MTKSFKNRNKPYLLERKPLSVFKFLIIYHFAKCQKKLIAIPEKNSKLMDGQTDNSDFKGPFIGLGFNY